MHRGVDLRWLSSMRKRNATSASAAQSTEIASPSALALPMDRATTVGRANVAGRFGRRYGVAKGLLLAFHGSAKGAGRTLPQRQ